ncbi:hypothetical protein GCM10010399_63670 [Dactylosporangium fulvum]|uniref:Uncharacterized protein n=1 Tax=Dactylosporangium fulvum TaxID=53359 RepID=A0ABY5W719_9ACTN|nr:hypothetical protein [Dactylosporangium fulvum]UWP85810.1 hypothetical protein Dfulv_16820 [Dactylosporangium fulvum]
MTPDHPGLLRRAAKHVRELAAATTPSPWTVESWSHGWDDGHTWRINGPTGDDLVTPCALQTSTETPAEFARADADVEYAALMHPPVGMALAVLFERSADAMAALDDVLRRGRMAEPQLAHFADLMEVVRVARQVLREEVAR